MTNSHDELLSSLNNIAKENNIYLVSRLQRSKYKALEAVEDKINSVDSGRRSGLGMHLFDSQGHSLLTSTDKLNNSAASLELLRKALTELKNINEKATKSPAVFQLERTTAQKDLANEFNFNKFTTIDLEEKLVNHNKKIKKLGEELGISNKLKIRTHFDVQENSWLVTRSDGTDIFWSVPSCRLSTSLSFKGKKQKVQDYVSKSSLNWDVLTDKPAQDNFFTEVKHVLNLLMHSADNPQYPAGNYPLIIDSQLGGLLAHEAFGHAAESDGICSGHSILSKNKKLAKGKKVASNIVSIHDATEENKWGYTPFSAFGATRESIEIVKEGLLNAAISDTLSGKKIGDAVRGCSRAQNFDDVPVPRMSNTFISVKNPLEGFVKYAKAEMIRDALLEKGLLKDKILFLQSSGGGGQVETHSGTFMFTFNYLHELTPNSVKLYRGSSFSGNILEALKAIKAGIGKVEIHGAGRCGKSGQAVHVSMGANQFLFIENTPAVTLGGS